MDLGDDGHCLYLICLFCFYNVGRKKKREREKRCESKGGRNYAAGDDTKRLKYAPKRLVPEFHSRLIPLRQNPEPSPTSVLRAYCPSGPQIWCKFPKRATRLFAFLITTPLSRQLIGSCLFLLQFQPQYQTAKYSCFTFFNSIRSPFFCLQRRPHPVGSPQLV